MEHGSSSELAYLGGFFDGEGCIHIGRGTDLRAAFGARHQIVIQVVQTSKFPLDRFKARWGGTVWTRGKPASPKHKNLWAWRLWDREGAIKFCRDILPFLVLKAPQVALCVQFHETTVEKFGKWNRMDKATWDERERLYHECRRLKLCPPGSTIA